jgi:hypothetical protein
MSNKQKKGQRIEIRPAKIKGKLTGFRVVLIGKNGEQLSQSEVLTSPANVRKNLQAQFDCLADYRSYNHDGIIHWWNEAKQTPLVDLTGKVVKGGGK